MARTKATAIRREKFRPGQGAARKTLPRAPADGARPTAGQTPGNTARKTKKRNRKPAFDLLKKPFQLVVRDIAQDLKKTDSENNWRFTVQSILCLQVRTFRVGEGGGELTVGLFVAVADTPFPTFFQEAAEAFVVSLLQDAHQAAMHAKRVTVMPKDITLVQQLRGEQCVSGNKGRRAPRTRTEANP